MAKTFQEFDDVCAGDLFVCVHSSSDLFSEKVYYAVDPEGLLWDDRGGRNARTRSTFEPVNRMKDIQEPKVDIPGKYFESYKDAKSGDNFRCTFAASDQFTQGKTYTVNADDRLVDNFNQPLVTTISEFKPVLVEKAIQEPEVKSMADVNAYHSSIKDAFNLYGLKADIDKVLKADRVKQPNPWDTMVGGTHYTSLKIQPLKRTLVNKGYEAFAGSCYTNIDKYTTRTKDDEVEQLKKARHVLDLWIYEAEKLKE